MPARISTTPRFWIFQSRAERYDLDKKLVVGLSEEWQITQNRKDVSAGDFVFLWQTSSDKTTDRSRNLIGWGIVRDVLGVKTQKGENAAPRAIVDYGGRFETPIDRKELREDEDLATLTILRRPAGTNFRVTSREALALFERVGWSSIPERFHWVRGSVYPLQALTDYRYDKSIQDFLAHVVAHVTGFGRPIDVREFWDLLSAYLRGDAEGASRSWPAAYEDSWSLSLLGTPIVVLLEYARRIAIATSRSEVLRLDHLTALQLVPPENDAETAAIVREPLLDVSPAQRRNELLVSAKQRGEKIERWEAVLGPVGRATGGATKSAGRSKAKKKKAARRKSKRSAPSAESAPPGDATAIEDPVEAEPESEPRAENEPDADGAEPEVSSASALSRLISTTQSDAPGDHDFLDLEGEILAVARLLADPETELPLAIGLFGYWGAGKTTFLENLQAQLARRNDPDSPGSGFHIAQVCFNAWHYMESDVWASLADHLFRTLDEEVRVKRHQKEEFENLLEELAQHNQVESRISNELEDVETRIRETDEQLAAAESAALARQAALERRLGEFGRTVGSPELRAEFLQALKGITETIDSTILDSAVKAVEEGTESYESLESEIARVQALAEGASWKDARPSRNQLMVTAVLLVGTLIASAIWSRWGVALSGLTATMAPLIVSVVNVLTKARDLKGIASQFLGRVREAEARAKERDPEVVELRAAREAAEVRRAQLEGEAARSKARREELEKRLEGEPVERRVLDFVRARAETSDYNTKLGTLALVRRDFQVLSDLLAEQRRRGADGDAKPLPSIRRIVLYIDDLDRCPRDRVMKVLEAVHLLLAYPLFAVVIAVDARWVEGSVEQHLVRLSRAGANGGSTEADGQLEPDSIATPEEYLEKIIQVPFWLKPLDVHKRARFLVDVLERAEREDEPVDDDPLGDGWSGLEPIDAANVNADGVGDPGRTTDESGDAAGAVAAPREVDPTEAAPSAPPLDGAAGDRPSSVHTAADGLSEDEDDDTTEADDWDAYAPWPWTEGEKAFFEVLGPLLGDTPRAAKRFLNLYGLCRAFAPDSTRESNFTAMAGEHRAVQLLYALLTGWPHHAYEVFRILEDNATYDDALEFLVSYEVANPTEDDPSATEPGLTSPDLARALEATLDIFRANDAYASQPISANTMVEWLPFVTRFGFQPWSASRYAY